MACEPEDNLENAGQFSSIIPPGMHAAVQSYLLAKIRGGSMNVNEILQDAACHTSCIPPGLLPRIKTWLLCQLSNTGGETPIPPSPECDEDAQAFITAAGITDETVSNAICVLVRDLKTYPSVGTKYWDREVLVYPFASNSTDSPAQRASSHSINLKNPLGPNNMVWSGTITHSDFGVQGNGTTGYGRTNFLVPSQNSFRTMYYVDLEPTVNFDYHFGAGDTAAWWYSEHNGVVNSYRANDLTGRNLTVASILGARFLQRYAAASKRAVAGNNLWTQFNDASTGVPVNYILVLAASIGGVAPLGSSTGYSNGRYSSFSFGSPFDTGGGNTEHLEYKFIWDKFNSTLGRGHP